MLVGDDFPELGSDLVTALAGLDVDDFSHVGGVVGVDDVWRLAVMQDGWSLAGRDSWQLSHTPPPLTQHTDLVTLPLLLTSLEVPQDD